MRAKFIRGQDPKVAMGLGDEDLREFSKALADRNFYAPVLDFMINGLTSGSIKERDAVRFVKGGIVKHYPRKILLWYNWYNNFNHTFWADDIKKFIITFNLPEIDFHGDITARTLRCEFNEMLDAGFSNSGKHYEITSFLQVHELKNDTYEDHFHQHNVFYPEDPGFNMNFVVSSISRVVDAAIKNMG